MLGYFVNFFQVTRINQKENKGELEDPGTVLVCRLYLISLINQVRNTTKTLFSEMTYYFSVILFLSMVEKSHMVEIQCESDRIEPLAVIFI